MRKIIRLIVALVMMILGGVSSAGLSLTESSADQAEEYKIKAALLYYFIQFTTWPTGQDLPVVVIGIYKDNPFDQVIDNFMKKQSALKGSVRVVTITDDEDILDCDVLFIPKSQSRKREIIMEKIGDNTVLTISEDENMVENGIMINFVKVSNSSKIGFEVNLTKARKHGISFNSRMLSLAQKVIY